MGQDCIVLRDFIPIVFSLVVFPFLVVLHFLLVSHFLFFPLFLFFPTDMFYPVIIHPDTTISVAILFVFFALILPIAFAVG